MFNREQARAFYDNFGLRQDKQAFYEDPATDDLVAHASFHEAGGVYELGCGTGRFAESLLNHHLPLSASYRGVDISTVMVDLAQKRLARFAERAEVRISRGDMHIDAADHSIDRIVSNYVLDLLSEFDIATFISEAERVLAPEGLLCLVSLTRGRSLRSALVTTAWKFVHRVNPALVGGCRPIELAAFFVQDRWSVVYQNVVTAYGVPSEVLIVSPDGLRAEQESVGTL